MNEYKKFARYVGVMRPAADNIVSGRAYISLATAALFGATVFPEVRAEAPQLAQLAAGFVAIMRADTDVKASTTLGAEIAPFRTQNGLIAKPVFPGLDK